MQNFFDQPGKKRVQVDSEDLEALSKVGGEFGKTLDLTGDRPLPLSEARKLKRHWEGMGWSADLKNLGDGKLFGVSATKVRKQGSVRQALLHVTGSPSTTPCPKKPDRVWTILHGKQLHLPIIPLHGVNVFLEDPSHDWKWTKGQLRYFSRIIDENQPVWLLLEFGGEGPKTCPKCHKDFPAGSNFCPDCGVKLMPKTAKEAAISQCRWDAAKDIRCPVASEILSRVCLQPLGAVAGYTVWLVDGPAVRDLIDIDYTQGGNPLVYGYVPQKEIWLEDKDSAPDLASTLLHELVEAYLMTPELGGLPYDTAHDLASGVEDPTRGPGRPSTKVEIVSWVQSQYDFWVQGQSKVADVVKDKTTFAALMKNPIRGRTKYAIYLDDAGFEGEPSFPPSYSVMRVASTLVAKSRVDIDQLGLVSHTESGVHFSTGHPVEFPFMHNPTPAPHMGGRFGQNIEPAGMYLNAAILDIEQQTARDSGWEVGKIAFRKPLVLVWSGYDEDGWKSRLAKAYGKTRAALTRALIADGYDGIVTVDPPYGVTEIVALSAVPKRLATKSPAEKEDEAIEDLSRPAPSKKPPRHDLRNEKVETDKKDEFGVEGDKDLSLNYKKVAARWVMKLALAGKTPPKNTPKSQKRQEKKHKFPKPPAPYKPPKPAGGNKDDEEHKPGDVWQTDKGWAASNPDGIPHAFPGENGKEQAEAYAKGEKYEGEGKGSEFDRPETITPDTWKKISPILKQETITEADFQKALGTEDIWETVNQLDELLSADAEGNWHPKKPKEPEKAEPDGEKKVPDEAVPEDKDTESEVVPNEEPSSDETAPGKGEKPPNRKKEKKEKPPKDPSPSPKVERETFNTVSQGVGGKTFQTLVSKITGADEAKMLAAYEAAKQEVEQGLRSSSGEFDEDLLKEAGKAFEQVRGKKAKTKKKKKKNDWSYDDDDYDVGSLGYGATPEELGRKLALAEVAQKQLTNPLEVFQAQDEATALAELDREIPEGERKAKLLERASATADHFKKLTPQLRAEAAVRMQELMKGITDDDDSPRATSLNAILDGMSLAAAAKGESVEANGVYLRPETAPTMQVLTRILAKRGDDKILLGSMKDFGTPDNRKKLQGVIDRLSGRDISDILGGEEGLYGDLLRDLNWDQDGSANEEEAKKMLTRLAVNEMTNFQAVIFAVASNPSTELIDVFDKNIKPVDSGKVHEAVARIRSFFKPEKTQKAVDAYQLCREEKEKAGLSPENIEEQCAHLKKEVGKAHAQDQKKAIEDAGYKLNPGNPEDRALLDATEEGDAALDIQHLPAGAQDVHTKG